MTEHNNPGPPERCYDDCPMNHTGNSEDCTCAGTMLDSDAALFARQRDDAQAIVLSVSRILGISHLADGLEHGRVTSAVRSWMDTAAQLTRERDSAASEAGRMREELADVRASREAWVLEADRLDVIATAAEYHTGPEECCDSECDHLHDDEGNFIGTDGEWCPHVEMRHATAEDAIEAHKVPLLEARIETLDREPAEDAQFREAVAAALQVSPILSNGGLVLAIDRLTRERGEALRAVEEELEKRDAAMEWADKLAYAIAPIDVIGEHTSANEPWVNALEIAEARPAIPADAEHASWADCMGIQDFAHKLEQVPTSGEWASVSVRIGSQYYPVTGVEQAENEWTGEESVAIVAAIPAPVSGSDTGVDGGDR